MNSSVSPNIIRETSSGPFLCAIQDEMLRSREIECVGAVDAQMVYALTRQLWYLQREDPKGEITMYINSPGGEVSSGLALYDAMQAVTCPIRTVCLGSAASMGAVIFAGGDRRDILPHGRVMIHDPLISGGMGGSAVHIQNVSRDLMKNRKAICTILAERTGRSLREIYRKTAKDTWFDAEEAVAFGLAHRVVRRLGEEETL